MFLRGAIAVLGLGMVATLGSCSSSESSTDVLYVGMECNYQPFNWTTSTETENTMWQIFSVYKIPEETYYITTNFNSDNDYQKFLNTIKERSVHNFSTNLTTEDKILTLSTCYSDTERTVVHAKLIKRSPK